jgi:hypothetical protein
MPGQIFSGYRFDQRHGVIEANVIEGHPGPPKTVVAVETWEDISIPKKLYHTSPKPPHRSLVIELQIRHLYMLLHRLMHDAPLKNNRLPLI